MDIPKDATSKIKRKQPSTNISFSDALDQLFEPSLSKKEAEPPKKIQKLAVKEPQSPNEEGNTQKEEPLTPQLQKSDDVQKDAASFGKRYTKPTKMYNGRKQTKFVKTIDTLHNLAMTVCIQNIETFTNAPLPVSYELFQPVLARCTPKQLEKIEFHNPKFEENSGPLWQTICKKAFPKATIKDNGESWKQCYKKLIEERENRLKQISSKIKKDSKAEQLTTKKISGTVISKTVSATPRGGPLTPRIPRRGSFQPASAPTRLGGGGRSSSRASSTPSSDIQSSIMKAFKVMKSRRGR